MTWGLLTLLLVLSLLYPFIFLRLAATTSFRFRSKPIVVDLLLLGVIAKTFLLLKSASLLP
jgi:hypothetical protein